MKKCTLGRTGLEVTILGYGAMALHDANDPTDDQAQHLLNALLDAGINFVDTSPDYGESERHIGQAIAHRRDEYYLATKCGCNVPRDDPDAPHHIWTRDMLLHNIETSLRRMKTDYVDIWQMHNASPEQIESEDLVRVMEDVKRQGKVRYVSISSTLPHIDTYIQQGVFDTYQIPYSALERMHEDVITAAAEAGAGIIIRGGVARGEPGGDLGSHTRWSAWEKADLDPLLSDGEIRSAFVLRFTISHPHMHTTIVGTKNAEHLAENLKVIEAGPLPPKVYDEAKRRLDQIGQVPAAVG